jgi:hypothetical protein
MSVEAPAPVRTVEQAPPVQAKGERRGPVSSGGHLVLRRCACGGVPGGDGECAACKARRLQRRAHAEAGGGLAPAIVHDVLRSAGRPLDAPVRSEMERRLGHDFSQVRVHADGRAADSAQAVEAQAYTVGRSVVFGAGRYAPATAEGRDLIAHELAHVVQHGPLAPPSGPLPIGAANDPAEGAADRAAAGRGTAGSTGAAVQLRRKVVVNPAGAASQIISHLGGICAVPIAASATGELSATTCLAAPPQSCECICDVLADATRTYTINVSKATLSTPARTLWNGTTTPVPTTSMGPTTSGTTNPTIEFPDTGSDVEFGSFQASGTAVWAPMWRILAHELCGHGRLGQSYAGGPGNRQQHDATIDTENAIAAEHGGPPRGHFADPKPPGKQGESFFNPVGDRSKVVYFQTNGLHHETP